MYDSFFSEKIDSIAATLYNNRALLCENDRKTEQFNEITWDHINEEVKKYIYNQIRHIPGALNKINYELISVDEQPEGLKFSDKEVEILAEYEHNRISLEKKEAGWRYGVSYDEDKKTDPMLVSWFNLDSYYKEHIKESIKAWPEILAKSNFKIEQLRTLCYCETQLKLRNI